MNHATIVKCTPFMASKNNTNIITNKEQRKKNLPEQEKNTTQNKVS